MLLEDLSYPDVENYLQAKDIILVPVGSVEQHSPYGLIGTDFITAERVARLAAETLEILVAPTMCYGVSPHHMAFAGTMTLTPETMIAVVCDLVRSLTTHGFKKVIFINGHGGNSASIQVALVKLKSEGEPAILRCVSWYELPGVDEICAQLYGIEDGDHATASEVAVTMKSRPYAFTDKNMAPATVKRPEFNWPLTADEFIQTFPDGRMMSAPWLATQAHGEQILNTAVRALASNLKSI